MTIKEMWKLASENLFQGIDSKQVEGGTSVLLEAIVLRKSSSETFGFQIEEDTLAKDSAMLKIAYATKCTALVLLLLKECWESGPAKMQFKRALRKVTEEIEKTDCGELLPAVLMAKIKELKPKR